MVRAYEEEKCCGTARLQVLESITDGVLGIFKVGEKPGADDEAERSAET